MDSSLDLSCGHSFSSHHSSSCGVSHTVCLVSCMTSQASFADPFPQMSSTSTSRTLSTSPSSNPRVFRLLTVSEIAFAQQLKLTCSSRYRLLCLLPGCRRGHEAIRLQEDDHHGSFPLRSRCRSLLASRQGFVDFDQQASHLWRFRRLHCCHRLWIGHFGDRRQLLRLGYASHQRRQLPSAVLAVLQRCCVFYRSLDCVKVLLLW